MFDHSWKNFLHSGWLTISKSTYESKGISNIFEEKRVRGGEGREEISWIHKIEIVTRIHSLRARYNLFKCSHFWRHREIEHASVVTFLERKKFERTRPGWKVLASTGRGPVARQLPAWWKVCELFSGVGVYISRVEEGSVAERAGLRPGDTILEVNGTPFRAVTHEEALKVSFYFHFPNQKHFLACVTMYHAQCVVAIAISNSIFFFSFFLLFENIYDAIRSQGFVSVSILYIFAYFYIFSGIIIGVSGHFDVWSLRGPFDYYF